MPSKSKKYKQVMFTPEVIREAADLLVDSLPKKDRRETLKIYSISLEVGEEWEHDNQDEFFAEYRRGLEVRYLRSASYNREFGYGEGGLNLYIWENDSKVTVTMPKREELEKVFEVFEVNAGKCRLVEPVEEKKPLIVYVFVSHTKLDAKFCDRFDNICASVGIRRFRSEFEAIEKPSWKTIISAISKSNALFLLVGKELVSAQANNKPDWKYTQNWISYEVGLAHQRGIDVWVVCDEVPINFPVPYFNNYAPHGLEPGPSWDYMKWVLGIYMSGGDFGQLKKGWRVKCRHCGITYSLHKTLARPSVICPQCLSEMKF